MKSKNYFISAFFSGASLAILLILFFPLNLFAASLASMSDTLSSQKAGELSNHRIAFTSPSGMSSGTIEVDLSSVVSTTGSVNETDIDLSYGLSGSETSAALTPTASAGTWGAVVNSLTKKLTLTFPLVTCGVSPCGVPIVPGNKVIIKIGTNATGGDAQMTNAAVGNSKLVRIDAGTDSGTLAVVLVDSGSIGVTSDATSGATGPASPTGLGATLFNSSQASLSWTDNATNESSFTIERSINGGTFAVLTTVGANVNTFLDSNVGAGNSYSYRVLASNSTGNSAYTNSATVSIPAAGAVEVGGSGTLLPSGTTGSGSGASTGGSAPSDAGFTSTPTPCTVSCQLGCPCSGTTTGGGSSSPAPTDSGTGTAGGTTTGSGTGTSGGTTGTGTTGGTTGSGAGTSGGTSTTLGGDALAGVPSICVVSGSLGCTSNTTRPPSQSCLEAPVIEAVTKEAQIDLECHGSSPAELLFVIERSVSGSPFVQIGSTPANLTTFSDTSVDPSTTYSYRARATNADCQSPYSNVSSARTFASGESGGAISGDTGGGGGGAGGGGGGGSGGGGGGGGGGSGTPLYGTAFFGDPSSWGMTEVNGASSPYAKGQFCARKLTAITPCVKTAGLPVAVSQMNMSVGGTVYPLSFDTAKQCYTGTIPIPPALGVYPLTLNATYVDGTTTTVNSVISVRSTCRFFIEATVTEDAVKKVIEKVQIAATNLNDLADSFGRGMGGGGSGGGLGSGRIGELIGQSQGLLQTLSIFAAGSLLLLVPSYLGNVSSVVRYAAQGFSNLFSLFGYKKKRRKRWGVVYDAFSKEPEALAIVRLYDVTTNKVIETQVTDQTGRFSFFTQPGTYSLSVTKVPFVYPSGVVRGRTDGKYANVYRGENIVIRNDDDEISVSIPIDPKRRERIKEGSFMDAFLDVLERVGPFVAVLSFAISITLVLYTPSVLNVAIFIINTILILLQFLVVPHLRKSWGIVFDDATLMPLSLATISLFDANSNKLLRSRLSDYQGRFNFLAPPGHYKILVTRPNYQFPSANHKIKRYKYLYYGTEVEVKKENEIVRVNIPMHKRNVTPGSGEAQEVANPEIS